ncbi:glycosyl hydrolase family 8 [Scatolibacter rhodanostii]|uniref:glycosyl hydrolase family 8 n=1 Tax=Scatolibacter rhodanostii TaxID=2014781 RepID=UPI000C07C607|nr:glycosyl hydrolase family 8 [Scatolibacter rhodanostii]
MKSYPNLFSEIGKSQEQIRQRIEADFNTMFFDDQEKIYFEYGEDMAYMMDTGNVDARTEGMSYGMMMAVQMDRQDIFDRLWLFSKTYMYQKDGKYQGYFAWSVSTSGEKNAEGPAPDGEEYYAAALFFASKRWGDKQAPFDYENQAKDILRHCVHQHELVEEGHPMWDPENYLIKFVPETPFSDPSYHLPHFYEIFAQRADEADRDFWKKAAQESRKYILKSCHPVTGMASEYAEFDGTPRMLFGKKGQYYSDSYRVIMNIGLDTAWNGKQDGYAEIANHLQAYFSENTKLGDYHGYLIDGTPILEEAMHSIAIIATNAAGALAADGAYRLQWVEDFWNTPLRKGVRRYYDNCLYFFSLLMLGGQYQMF